MHTHTFLRSAASISMALSCTNKWNFLLHLNINKRWSDHSCVDISVRQEAFLLWWFFGFNLNFKFSAGPRFSRMPNKTWICKCDKSTNYRRRAWQKSTKIFRKFNKTAEQSETQQSRIMGRKVSSTFEVWILYTFIISKFKKDSTTTLAHQHHPKICVEGDIVSSSTKSTFTRACQIKSIF